MTNERVYYLLLGCLRDLEDQCVDVDWAEEEIEEIVYTQCALEKLLDLVSNRPNKDPELIIEDFYLMMTQGVAMASSDDQRFVFRVGQILAMDVLDLIKENKT